MRNVLCMLFITLTMACMRPDPKAQPGGPNAPEHCSSSQSGPPITVCAQYYFECMKLKEREEYYGRAMGPCRQH